MGNFQDRGVWIQHPDQNPDPVFSCPGSALEKNHGSVSSLSWQVGSRSDQYQTGSETANPSMGQSKEYEFKTLKRDSKKTYFQFLSFGHWKMVLLMVVIEHFLTVCTACKESELNLSTCPNYFCNKLACLPKSPRSNCILGIQCANY